MYRLTVQNNTFKYYLFSHDITMIAAAVSTRVISYQQFVTWKLILYFEVCRSYL